MVLGFCSAVTLLKECTVWTRKTRGMTSAERRRGETRGFRASAQPLCVCVTDDLDKTHRVKKKGRRDEKKTPNVVNQKMLLV